MRRQIVFRCPHTGTRVQLRLDEEAVEAARPDDTHVSVACPACNALHFVKSSTGELLSRIDRRQ